MENYSDVLVPIIVKEKADPLNNENKNLDCVTKNLVVIQEEDNHQFVSAKSRTAYPTDFALLNGVEYNKKNDYCNIMLRSSEFSAEKNRYKLKFVDSDGHIQTTNFENKKLGIRPQICLDAKKVAKHIEEIKLNNIETEQFSISKELDDDYIEYHRINFGEFPQYNVRGLDRLFDKEYSKGTMRRTGRTFLDAYQDNLYEYECKSNNPKKPYSYKVVRASLSSNSFSVELSSGLKVDQSSSLVWILVKPIAWKILNWDRLPTYINPKGTGEDEVMNLISEDALFSGLCFHDITFVSNTRNCKLWQNSLIRAYLNGIDLEENLKVNGNLGLLPKSFNFGEENGTKNFVTNAFNISTNEIKSLIGENNLQSEDKNRNYEYKQKNPYGFDFKELSNDVLLEEYIKSNIPVFLHGPSGVGKSQRVKSLDPDATRITLRPQMNPEEIDGTLNRETGSYIPPLWYQQLTEKCLKAPNKKHILFIDELTNVKPTVQSLVYSIVLDRAGKDGLWPLPENAVVVAAGNESADNLAANPLTNALFRRFCHIYYEVNVDDWLKWATSVNISKQQSHLTNVEVKNESRIHPAILAFIQSHGQEVLNQTLDEEEPKIVTDPRKWEIASKVLYATKNPYALLPAIGEELTISFVDFVKTIHISVEDVLNKNYNPREFVKMDFSDQLSTSLGLIDANENELPQVRGFIKKFLGKEVLANFDSMWIKNDPERAQIIDECQIVEHSFKYSDEKNNSVETSVKLSQKNVNPSLKNELITIDELFEKEKSKKLNGLVALGRGYYAIKVNFTGTRYLCEVFDKMGKTLADGKSYCGSDITLNNFYDRKVVEYLYFGLNGTYSCNPDDFIEIYDINEIDFSSYMDCDVNCKEYDKKKGKDYGKTF